MKRLGLHFSVPYALAAVAALVVASSIDAIAAGKVAAAKAPAAGAAVAPAKAAAPTAAVEAAPVVPVSDGTIDKAMQAKRRPKVFITVFNNGYGGDPMPQGSLFEKMLKEISDDGHFNTVLCRYSPEREALCKKHKILMLVDLLADGHHVFKNPKECEALCKKLQNNPTVVGYHLWSDTFGKMGSGRERDINNVHQWDPTHATYIGTYQSGGINHLAKSDYVSYYDFAWKRGITKNFPNLFAAWNAARKHDNRLGRYVETDAGKAGAGNYNRELFIQNTSIACGMRGTLWFIGSRIMDMGSCKLNEFGKDVAKINAWIQPMWDEIPKLGLPYAIYATPVTKNFDDSAMTGGPAMAPGLGGHEFPADFWLQPVGGEFVMGVSKYEYTEADAVYMANLNAYAGQDVQFKITKPLKPAIFDRATGKYKELVPQAGVYKFKMEPAGAALLRFL